MKRYPVYKALYKPFLTAGVPIVVLVIEIVCIAIFCTLRLWIALIPVLCIHIIIMLAIKQDAFILSILFDIAFLKKTGSDYEKK